MIIGNVPNIGNVSVVIVRPASGLMRPLRMSPLVAFTVARLNALLRRRWMYFSWRWCNRVGGLGMRLQSGFAAERFAVDQSQCRSERGQFGIVHSIRNRGNCRQWLFRCRCRCLCAVQRTISLQ